MKTIKRTTALIITLVFLASFSLNANTGGDKFNKIKNRISSFMSHPKIAKDKQEIKVVFVDISINNVGEIVINDIYGHKGYKEYVVAQMEKIQFNPKKYTTDESLIFKFTFK